MTPREALILKLFTDLRDKINHIAPDRGMLWESCVDEVDQYLSTIDEEQFPYCYNEVKETANQIVQSYSPDSER
jgi:flavorubredoxin